MEELTIYYRKEAVLDSIVVSRIIPCELVHLFLLTHMLWISFLCSAVCKENPCSMDQFYVM